MIPYFNKITVTNYLVSDGGDVRFELKGGVRHFCFLFLKQHMNVGITCQISLEIVVLRNLRFSLCDSRRLCRICMYRE